MKALVWRGTEDIRCESVPDPKIEQDRDAIIKVTSCAICGSDLHLFDHFMPGMESGDIMGHETMGEVVEVAPGAKHALKVGDRVVVPFTIICGECEQCRRGNFSVCERTNRNKQVADKAFGHGTAGLFGYTHLTGGYFRLTTGLTCPVFGLKTPYGGVDVWTEKALVRGDWGAPQIYSGADAKGARLR